MQLKEESNEGEQIIEKLGSYPKEIGVFAIAEREGERKRDWGKEMREAKKHHRSSCGAALWLSVCSPWPEPGL